MQRYCLGFAFDTSGNVALIRKNRPDWMKGKLNGVGGKANDGETCCQAMVREFQEETGVITSPFMWKRFASITNNINYDIDVFHILLSQETLSECKTTTDEEVLIIPKHKINEYYVENELPWLIELASRNVFSNSPYEAQVFCSIEQKLS